MFMNRLSGDGTSGRVSPNSASAAARLSVQLIAGAAEPFVSIAVAGGDQGVVDAAGSVDDDGQDRAPLVGDKDAADLRDNPADRHARMLH
jgi:hypothetical protein